MSAPERDSAGQFLPGNRIWENSPAGKGTAPLYDDPAELWADCCKYFEWATTNHIQTANGDKLARPFTVEGLCNFLGFTQQTWSNYRRREVLAETVALADQVIYQQAFEGAAVGMFQHQIIARKLGLADRQEITGKDGGPVQAITSDMDPREAAEAYAATLHGDEE